MFHGQVLEYSPLFDPQGAAKDLPSINQVYEICYTLKFWLEWQSNHVAVFYDSQGGSIRSGFIAAAYLKYSHQSESVIDAFSEFYKARFHREGARVLCELLAPWQATGMFPVSCVQWTFSRAGRKR